MKKKILTEAEEKAVDIFVDRYADILIRQIESKNYKEKESDK